MHKSVRRAAVACIAVSLSSAADGEPAAEEEVLQVERELGEAFLRNDGRALSRIYADDCTFTTPSGVVLDKPQEMQARSSGALRFDTYVIEEIKVRAYGDGAVLNALYAITGRNSKGRIGGRYRYTKVFVKNRGAWRMVAALATRVEDSPAPAVGPSTPSPPPVNSPHRASEAEQEVLKVNRQWMDALVQGDSATLEQVFAGEFVFIHNDGKVENKSQFIEPIKSERRKYPSLFRDDVVLRVYGDVAVLTARASRTVVSGGKSRTDRVRALDVYAKRNGRWQLVSLQTTRITQ